MVQGLIADSLAPSLRKAYTSAQGTYGRFCHAVGEPMFPASEQLLLLFVADLSQRVVHGTIRSYLATVRHAHLERGLQDPLEGKGRLELALKGVRRQRPRARDTRLPITTPILISIGQSLVKNACEYDQLLIWAACYLSFFGFMRSGELTVPEGTIFDPARHLTPKDIMVDDRVNPTMLKIRLKTSKTDQTREGINLFVGRTWNSLCPVVAMLRYLSARGMDDGPLFHERNGTPLPRRNFVAYIKLAVQQAGMNPAYYSGHSFRIGAATTAASRGISDATIQIMGRWASDSFTRYIRSPEKDLASLSQCLAT